MLAEDSWIKVAQFAASAVWSRGESTLRKCAER